MTSSEHRIGSNEAKLPPLTPSSSRESDSSFSSTSQRHQNFSPPALPSSAVATASLLPPPPPTRLHSYHHPLSNSYTSGTSYYDRNRPPPPSLWSEHRSPPMEHRLSERPGSSFSRVLPPLSTSALGSSSGTSAFQLPSLSASLPSSASWHGRESQQAFASNGAFKPTFREKRRPGQDALLPSVGGPFTDYRASRSQPAETSSTGHGSPTAEEPSQTGRKPTKAHVPSACLNCKRAHLACDVGRPCRRCINLGKSETCIDVQHKKRGRPRLKDRPSSQTGLATQQPLDTKSDVSGSPASASYTRQSPSSESGYFRSPTRSIGPFSPPMVSSSTVMQVAGKTHGVGAHSRAASNSVSASSYPFSRPDHLRHPIDAGIHSAGYSSSSWPHQQNAGQAQDASGKSALAQQTPGRQHTHLLSYEQQYPVHVQQQQQPNLGHSTFQHPISPRLGATSPNELDSIMSAVVTMICSTNLQCARISEECTALLGYQPSELNERSLFELVHPAETSRLQEIWTSLIDPIGIVPQAIPAAAEAVMDTPPARLMTPAAGTIFVQEDMRLRQRNGMYDFYSVRLHLGGGFGVDLYRRETLDRAYIVASLLKLGNDAVHPDPALLRSPYFHDTLSSRGFRTPSASSSAGGWEAEGFNARSSRLNEQHQRPRSESINRRITPRENNKVFPSDVAAGPEAETAEQPLPDRSRGIKRGSGGSERDGPSSCTRPPPSLATSHSVGGGDAATPYSATKRAAYSPPPGVNSLLAEPTRGTSRDGILC